MCTLGIYPGPLLALSSFLSSEKTEKQQLNASSDLILLDYVDPDKAS